MDPLTMGRVRGATRLVHDAIDAAAPAIARAHRGVTDIPFAIIGRVEAIAAPVGVVRAVHDTLTDGTYRTIRSINRILAAFTSRALDCAEGDLQPQARSELARSVMMGADTHSTAGRGAHGSGPRS